MSQLLLSLLILLSTFSTACHKLSQKRSSAELKISRGEADPGHPEVGIVHGLTQFCTGTLIGPQVVLTAAHCLVYRTSDDVIPSAMFSFGKTNYTSHRLKIHPGFKRSVENEFDVALLFLDEPVLDVIPATLATTLPTVGQAITVVGFGADSNSPPTEEYPQGYPEGSGTKRLARQTISTVTPTWFKFEGASVTWHGDSGGPSYTKINGQEYLLGVHSTADFEKWGVDASVGSHCQWIKDTAGSLEVRYQSPECPASTTIAAR